MKFVTALALLAAAMVLYAWPAGATHVRPKGASPMRLSLVPAYNQCTAPNRTHGAPLAFPSCSPPVQSSGFLTIGSPDANGAGANAAGFVHLKVKATSPEDLLITLTITDVRCRPGTAAGVCSSPNAADGPDYSGEVAGNATIRISDHYNGPSLTEAATVQDIPFPINAPCSNTTDTTTGGVCTVTTSSQAHCPPTCQNFDGQRSVVELGQFEVSDGGPDGLVGSNDNTTFMREGIFIP